MAKPAETPRQDLSAPVDPRVKEFQRKEELRTEGLQRLEDARAEKRTIQSDLEECYYFSAPRRRRQQSSQVTIDDKNRPSDANELQTSLAMEVSDDFAGMLISSFTPPEAPWAERKPDASLSAADQEVVKRRAQAEDKKIFGMIRSSNFYAELGKTAVPDAAIGVVAVQIFDKHPALPPVAQGVPIRELEIALGPDGRIDDRFIVRQTKFRHLPGLLPGVAFEEEIANKIRSNKNDKCAITWGWWRNWENVGDEEWQHVVYVDDKLVHEGKLVGAGSCPLCIGRIGASPDFAWPDGPMIKTLPDLRQLDEMQASFVENIDFTIRPPFAYEDDGVINIDDGVEPGMGYPKRPNGGRNVFEKIYEPNPLDAALFQKQELEHRVKRMHYVDYPEQPGKTPPTATQWLDEMVMKQKRIGTPGYAYWTELPYEVFLRFKYIGEKRGKVEVVKDPNGNPAMLYPQNPAERANDNQEVLTATRLGQIGTSMFPQTWQVAVDEAKTLAKFQEKMGDEIIVFRTPEDIQKAVGLYSQLGPMFGPRNQGGLVAAAGNENAPAGG